MSIKPQKTFTNEKSQRILNAKQPDRIPMSSSKRADLESLKF